LPKAAACKVAGKLFLASGLCGRASGQRATADLVKRIQDSSAWDSTLIIITYDENGGRWDHVPPPPISSLTRPLSGRRLSGHTRPKPRSRSLLQSPAAMSRRRASVRELEVYGEVGESRVPRPAVSKTTCRPLLGQSPQNAA